MEIVIMSIAFALIALGFCLKELANLVKQLKSGKSVKLLTPGKTLSFSGSVSLEDKKKEACGRNANSSKNDRNE